MPPYQLSLVLCKIITKLTIFGRKSFKLTLLNRPILDRVRIWKLHTYSVLYYVLLVLDINIEIIGEYNLLAS